MSKLPNNNIDNLDFSNVELNWSNPENSSVYKAPNVPIGSLPLSYKAPDIPIGSKPFVLANSAETIKHKQQELLQNIESVAKAEKYYNFPLLFSKNPKNIYYLGHALFLLNYKNPKTLNTITLIMKYKNAIKDNFVAYPKNIPFIMKLLGEDYKLGIKSTGRFGEFIIDLQVKIREGMSISKAFDTLSESYLKINLKGGKKRTYRSRKYKKKQTFKKH